MELAAGLIVILGLAAFCCAAYVGLEDRVLRRHLDQGASPKDLRYAPLYLFRPELFSPEGNRHRVRMVRALVIAVVLGSTCIVLAEWVS